MIEVFKSVAGSRLYGLNDETSDHDSITVVVDPEAGLPFKTIPNPPDDPNNRVFTLGEFFKHLAKGSSTCTEILFSPSLIAPLISQEDLDKLRSLTCVVSYAKTIRGFALAEYNRAFGLTQKPVAKYADKVENLRQALAGFQVSRQDIFAIIHNLESLLGEPLEETVTNLKVVGEKRLDLINKFGYDVKAACNAIRILYQGTEFLSTGKIQLPLSALDKATLFPIKKGLISKEEVLETWKTAKETLDCLDLTHLPARPDLCAYNTLYRKIINAYSTSK